MGNKLWRLDNITSKVVLYRNMGFIESDNGFKESSDDMNDYYWEYTPGLLDEAKGNKLGTEIFRILSGNTLRVSHYRVYNGKLVQTLLEGHSILSLEGSISGDCDVKKNTCTYVRGRVHICSWKSAYVFLDRSYVKFCARKEYQVVCTRPDIASADVGMLDGVRVDDTWMCGELGSYFTAHGGFVDNISGVYDTYGGCKGDYLAEWTQMESGAELRLVAVVAIGVFTHEIPGPRFHHRGLMGLDVLCEEQKRVIVDSLVLSFVTTDFNSLRVAFLPPYLYNKEFASGFVVGFYNTVVAKDKSQSKRISLSSSSTDGIHR
ncbi:hypothetical protein Tco_0863704 [Tanacetum coccineum]